MKVDQTFKITLNKEFAKDTLLQDHVIQRKLKVVSEPIHKYHIIKLAVFAQYKSKNSSMDKEHQQI